MSDALFIQRPAGAAQQLFLLFHGSGGTPEDMRALGERLAQAFPQAAVVGVASAFTCDSGPGQQWFSDQEFKNSNRPELVALAMPFFLAAVQRWQTELAVPASATALIGFAQGAILVLEASKQTELLAARVVGIAGRFITLPEQLHTHCTVHLIHGKSDAVVPCGLTVQAAEHLVAMGADVTADVLPFVRHELPDEVMNLVLERLQGHIPLAKWREALAAEALASGRTG